MPIKEGPDGPFVHVPHLLFTSVRDRSIGNGDSDETQSTLLQIDQRTTDRDDRLEAIKLLRVMLMARNSRRTRDELSGLPQRYMDVYRHPRLSTVADKLGMSIVQLNPEHLDIDWFGARGETWWPLSGNPAKSADGTAFEVDVAEKLLAYLEDSMHIQKSDRAANADPDNWRWQRDRIQGGWLANVRAQTVDTRIQVETIVFEWDVNDATGAFSVGVVGNHLRINTPWPTDPKRIRV